MSRWKSPLTRVQDRARRGPSGPKSLAPPTTDPAPGIARRKPTVDDLNFQCDPYLRWAVLTDWLGFVGSGGWDSSESGTDRAEQQVRVILKAFDQDQMRSLLALPGQVPGFAVPPLYHNPLTPGAELSLYATMSVKLSLLPMLLHNFPGLRWELCAPLKDQGAGVSGSAKGYYGRQKSARMAPDQLQAQSSGQKTAVQPAGSVRGGVIAVVDFGCPLLQASLADASGTASRLAVLWDQGDSRPDEPWHMPAEAGYGGMLDSASLRSEWSQVHGSSNFVDEADVYKRLNYLIEYEDARSRVYRTTHGAHVLDVAGGAVDPATGGRDWASRAKLVFVQLPYQTAMDSSGCSLSAHLLDALRYIFHIADSGSPLAVNISYGNTAGPHDGSSLAERAIDELLASRPKNAAVVLAAGNSRRAGLHVQRKAFRGRSAMFRVGVAAGDQTDTFVEFWYAAPAQGYLEFRARLPAGQWSNWLGTDSHVELVDEATQDKVALLVHQTEVPNGCRSMAMLALRPTDAPDGDDASLAEPGIWEVEARLQGPGRDDGIEIDAWVERDDPRCSSRLKQTSFVGLEPTDADDTLCSVATGDHTVVVGGFLESDGVEVDYSSTGPRRPEQWPMLHAICERDAMDQGLQAAAVRSGETFLMNGTSVAAPVMARHIYNLLQESMIKDKVELDRPQLLKALRAQAQRSGSLIRVSDSKG